MAALAVGVLDVVVHEAEVVPQLHGGGPRKGRSVLPGERLVGEQAQERADALSTGS